MATKQELGNTAGIPVVPGHGIAVALVHLVGGGRDDPSPEPLCDDWLTPDGFRASSRQHSVQNRHADGSLGLLGSEAAGSQPWSDQRLVTARCRVDQRALTIIRPQPRITESISDR